METVNNKLQEPNDKQCQNTNNQKGKRYDLEDRTLIYARKVGEYVQKLPRSVSNIENGKQLIRAAGSVGANYIEANEALGKKDFAMRIRIARKEAKESRYWLLLTEPEEKGQCLKGWLINEATELIKIFSSILLKFRSFKF
jgi:four helix bundle protein